MCAQVEVPVGHGLYCWVNGLSVETHPQCRECVSVHRGVQWFGKAETQNCESPLSL